MRPYLRAQKAACAWTLNSGMRETASEPRLRPTAGAASRHHSRRRRRTCLSCGRRRRRRLNPRYRAKGQVRRHEHGIALGIDWDRYDDLGRRLAGNADPVRLRVPLSEASLIIEHPGAAIDHVYLAFDGLIAALVNMTDTLGRLVNTAYSLGIDPRQASLLAVRDRCNAASSLGVVLHDGRHTDWLRRVQGSQRTMSACRYRRNTDSAAGCVLSPRRTLC